jgi:hypothetical protein
MLNRTLPKKQRGFKGLRQFLGLNGVGFAGREFIHIYDRQQDPKKKASVHVYPDQDTNPLVYLMSVTV